MALNIKNHEVERLAEEVSLLTGESKTEAVRRALEERRERLSFQVAPRDRRTDLLRFLHQEIWGRIAPERLGKVLSKEEEEALLGYGPSGA